MTPLTLPLGYTRIKRVKSFHELVTTRFADGINALCWQRTLPGNFSEVVQQLGIGQGITTVDESLLAGLSVSAAGRVAIDILLNDQRLLCDLGLSPELNCVHEYLRDVSPGPVPTDVFSFHADRATTEADTFLCTYNGPSGEGLRNDEAQRRVDIPEIRAELLKLSGGKDDDGVLEFLNENCYDLHYAPVPQAQPFSFERGNLRRIAVEYPGSPVPPCIHRAPKPLPDQAPRLLLIRLNQLENFKKYERLRSTTGDDPKHKFY